MIIRNKKTGETKEIDPQQASQFGITQLPPEHQPAQEAPTDTAQPSYPAGGMIPTIGGTIGNMVGSLLGPAMGRAGTVGGTGTGAAIEDSIMAAQGKDPSPGQKMKRLLGEEGTQIAGGEAGNLVSKFLGKIFPGIAKALVKVSLPETGNAAAEAATKEILGNGESTASQVVDRGMSGSAASLVRQADTQKKLLSTAIDKGIDTINTVSSHLDSSLGDAGGENSAQKFLRAVLQDTKDYIASHANISVDGKVAATNAIDKELNAAIDKAGTTGWQSVADLKNVGNNLSKSGQLSEAEAAKDAGYTALRSTVQKKLTAELPEFGKLWTDYGFYNNVERLASKKAGQPFLTRGDIMLLTGLGGGAGIASGNPVTGLVTGAASTGAVKSVTSPLFTTNLAQFLTKAPRFVAPAAQIAGGGAKQLFAP